MDIISKLSCIENLQGCRRDNKGRRSAFYTFLIKRNDYSCDEDKKEVVIIRMKKQQFKEGQKICHLQIHHHAFKQNYDKAVNREL